jgi:hypothetical protein
MTDWILIPCLRALFMEFNRIAPSRDHASDGAKGDAAHEQEVSDHNPDEVGKVPIHDADHINEVHAIDVDDTLRESDLTMEKVVQFLLGRCRSGAEKRLRYMIYNRRIWSASSGWVQKTYTGASPHTEHAHFSASYTTSLEASTASWHLEDIPVALTAADKTWITNTVKAEVAAVYADNDTGPLVSCTAGHAILSHPIPDGTKPGTPQTAAYAVIEHIGQVLVDVQTQVAALSAKP